MPAMGAYLHLAMSAPIGTSASELYAAVLVAEGAAALERAADEWLDAHIANEVVSMQLAPVTASGSGDRLHLLIVYKGGRRVRRA